MTTKKFVPIYVRMASIGRLGGFEKQFAAIQGYPGLPTIPLRVAIEARRLAIYCCGRDAANVERQLDLCRRYASRAFEQSTIATLIDVGATRSALADLRDRARQGEVNVLVIESPDRLSREAQELNAIVQGLHSDGIQIIAAANGTTWRRPDSFFLFDRTRA